MVPKENSSLSFPVSAEMPFDCEYYDDYPIPNITDRDLQVLLLTTHLQLCGKILYFSNKKNTYIHESAFLISVLKQYLFCHQNNSLSPPPIL